MTPPKTIPDQIRDMEARAKQCRVGVASICLKAGIARSTWANWKSGKFSPRMLTWGAVQLAFDAAIEASDPGPTKLINHRRTK